MDYNQALEYIGSTSKRGSKLGLSRVMQLLENLGSPQNALRIIHVAGTNGKGSVCSMLKSIISCSGYKVGVFSSPPITKKNECYSINNSFISDTDYAKIVSYVKEYAEQMLDLPTEFEIETAMAFEYFAREKCDIVIIETGMGGAFDATNVSDSPILSIITDISIDHQTFLGDTIQEIAKQKCGIIKQDRPVVFGGTNATATEVVKDTASALSAPLTIVDYSKIIDIIFGNQTEFVFDSKKYCINMLGSYQPLNASVALTAIQVLRDSLGFEISDESIETGLLNASWRGRFELVSASPKIIYDGAHNLNGMEQSVKSIKQYFGDQKVNILMGVMADKEYKKMVELLCEVTNESFTVTPNNPRSLSAESLSDCFKKHSVTATSFVNILDGVSEAVFSAKQSDTPLVILGTLYMYADIMSALEKLGII